MPERLSRTMKLILAAFFGGFILFAFSPVLQSFFDPQEFLTFLNPLGEEMSFGEYMINGWSWHNSQGEFIGFFRPLASVTYMIEFPVFGFNPIGYKLVNLMMHLLCAGLIARFVHVLSRQKWLSLFAGALLVFHPGVVVATGMISARPDIMATIFTILALTSTYYLSRNGNFTWRATVPAFFMLLALASKELGMINIIILPIMYFFWPDRFKCRSNTLVFLGSLLIVGSLYFFVREAIFGNIGGYGSYTAFGVIPSHIATIIAQGTGAFFVKQSFMRMLMYFSVLFVILSYARLEFRKWQKVVVAMLIVGACSFQSIIGDIATHYVYITAAVAVLFLAYFVGCLVVPGRKGNQIKAVIAILVLLAFGALTRRESIAFNRIYIDCEKVYTSLEHISNSLPREEGSICLVLVSDDSPIEAEMKIVPFYMKSIDPGSACEFIRVREIDEEVNVPVLVWTGNGITIR